MTDFRLSIAELNSFFKITGCLLVFSLLSLPLGAFAQDVLLGTVVSVDREKGSFILQLNDPQENTPEIVTIQGDEKNGFFLPGCVEVGESVRVWGKYGVDGAGSFHAEVVRGPGRGLSDKSGVRSRLNRGLGKQYGRQSGRSRNRHE